jgi:hypothetical protein
MIGEEVIDAHLDCVMIVIEEQHMGIASLLDLMSGKSISVINCTHFRDIAIFLFRKYVNNMKEDLTDPILHRLSANIYLAVKYPSQI